MDHDIGGIFQDEVVWVFDGTKVGEIEMNNKIMGFASESKTFEGKLTELRVLKKS